MAKTARRMRTSEEEKHASAHCQLQFIRERRTKESTSQWRHSYRIKKKGKRKEKTKSNSLRELNFLYVHYINSSFRNSTSFPVRASYVALMHLLPNGLCGMIL